MSWGIGNLGGGGGALNFQVVGGENRPTNPKENTIWVPTSVSITGWKFGAAEPTADAVGEIWIETGSQSDGEFNAVKKNVVILYPVGCYQWNGAEWVSYDMQVYVGGEWVEIITGLHLSDLPEGALVRGIEGDSEENFYLSKHDYESELNGSGRVLMTRKNIYSKQMWDSDSGSVYATCDLDTWFNGAYKNAALPTEVQTDIGTVKFKSAKGNGDYSITTLQRGIFTLSAAELGLESSFYPTGEGETLPIANILKIAYLNGVVAPQWLRTPFVGNTKAAGFVNTSGGADGVQTNVLHGARPCLTLPSTTRINPTPNADGSYNIVL